MPPRRLIVGLRGPELTASEQSFLREAAPVGIILFGRNCQSRKQIQSLTEEVRSILGDDCLVLIDEEGGRVQRLRPPVGRWLPAASRFGDMYAEDPARAHDAAQEIARLTAHDLRELGINTNCAPVADLRLPGMHDIVGDRAYGETPEVVAALASAVATGLMAGGVLPVVKHIPGHGRARCDSHLALPVVDTALEALTATDFDAFLRLNTLPAAMTAHVVYTSVDETASATVSPKVVSDVIRGIIGFDGLLMTDDLSMKALDGSIRQRAQRSIDAGCDVVLHCNGELPEMEQAAEVCPDFEGISRVRLERALAVTSTQTTFDAETAVAQLSDVLDQATGAALSRADPTA